jgi:hypothetical protein
MDLAKIGQIHIFSLPIQASMLATIRQQLWAISDRQRLAITQLDNAQLVHCRRLPSQPLTYLSALTAQLIHSNNAHPELGNYLLEQLIAMSDDQPSNMTTPWQGAVHQQGYLYLQPTMAAIATWLHHLPSHCNLAISNCPPLLPTAASITLQYIYTRCTQLVSREERGTAALVAMTARETELIGAVLDVWDAILLDRHLVPDPNQLVLSVGQRLVESFLEFEKGCQIGATDSRAAAPLRSCLLEVVQVTVKIILQNYWNLEPLSSW